MYRQAARIQNGGPSSETADHPTTPYPDFFHFEYGESVGWPEQDIFVSAAKLLPANTGGIARYITVVSRGSYTYQSRIFQFEYFSISEIWLKNLTNQFLKIDVTKNLISQELKHHQTVKSTGKLI